MLLKNFIMRFLTLFSFLFISNINAQKIYTIKDTIDGSNISFASIKIIGTDKGFYSDELGRFSSNFIKGVDSIEISHINYYSIVVKVNKLNENIFLKPKSNLLSEVIISTKKKTKEQQIGYVKKAKTLSWFIQPKSKLATLIKLTKKYNNNSIIKSIQIPIGKKTIKKVGNKFKRISPDFKSVFRVELFSNKDSMPSLSLLKTPIIINCNQNSSNIIDVDVSDQYISFPKEGVFISVEMIGEEKGNELGEIVFPSFKFTKKKKKNISSVSYYKSVFSNKKWINIRDSFKFKTISEYNMGVGLVLSIYEN